MMVDNRLNAAELVGSSTVDEEEVMEAEVIVWSIRRALARLEQCRIEITRTTGFRRAKTLKP
jgi:hypothetical protein